MDQGEFIGYVVSEMIHHTRMRGLFLGGSYGQGTADSFSDIDLIALVEPDAHEDMIAVWRGILESIAPIVFWNRRGQEKVLLNAITADWLRCDLSLMPPSAFAGRARKSVKPLIDRDGLYETLPESLAEKGPDPDKVKFLIDEFIRVLGLLHVVIGRGEYLVAVTGAGILRDHLTNLMLEETASAGRGGALHLSKALPPPDMALLLSLPGPKPDRNELIEAHFQIARQFLPRAYGLAARLGLPWPEGFERATLRKLGATLGDSVDWQGLAAAPNAGGGHL